MIEKEAEIKYIRAGTLIDGISKDPITDAVIVVNGTKIEAVGNETKIKKPSNAKIIDATNNTVMSGLMDAHVHFQGFKSRSMARRLAIPTGLRLLRGVEAGHRLLESGYTTVRETGGTFGPLLKKAIEEGTIIGPRIIAAGRTISQTGGHSDTQYLPYERALERADLVDGKDECLKAVRKRWREGVDFVKIMTSGGSGSMRDPPEISQFNLDEIKTICDEAHRLGMKVATHCYPPEGIIKSVKGGVDTIEHGNLADEESMQVMIDNNVIMVTTVAIHPIMVKHGVEWGMSPWTIERSPGLVAFDTIRKAYKMGVKLATGSDFGGYVPMGDNALELEYYVEKCGVSPMDAIISATKNCAEALGLENDIGTIEPGKFADIILVEGNPLKDIKVLKAKENIKMVIKNGAIVKNLN